MTPAQDRRQHNQTLSTRFEETRSATRAGRRLSLRIAVSILCGLVFSTLFGCVPVPRGDDPLDVRFMTPDELRDYSERVFRSHNKVTTRLMMAPPMDVSERSRRKIEQVESRMYETCASLNEIASARASGREVDLELENKVRTTVRSCAESTLRLKSLLDSNDIK